VYLLQSRGVRVHLSVKVWGMGNIKNGMVGLVQATAVSPISVVRLSCSPFSPQNP
jgi:hypothetical protein